MAISETTLKDVMLMLIEEQNKKGGVRRAMETARAAAVIASDRADADKISAIDVLAARGDLDVRGMLAGLSAASLVVAEAAAAAVARIDRRQAMVRIVPDLAYGIGLGSVLLLAAVGLSVTFGTMGVINMAHGEMVMLGAPLSDA